MKELLRKLFSPILGYFESGREDYHYEKSHRKILIVIGILFLVLSLGSLYAAIAIEQLGGLVPFVVFFLLGFVCEIVGWLGSDRAVSKIWKAHK